MTSSQMALFPDGESWPPAGHARATAWQAVAAAWTTHARACGGTSCDSWLRHVPAGSSARTCLGFTPSGAEQTLPSCGTTSHSSAIGGPSGFWTLNTSVSPRDAVASSLSDVLETGPHLSRYCLSPKAARGILRRAERRGRVLPPALQEALETLAQSAPSEAADPAEDGA